MLSAKEERNIRHRLAIGNSPKQIALSYSGIKGIRGEIEEICTRMRDEQILARHARRQIMAGAPKPYEIPLAAARRAPQPDFAAGREEWWHEQPRDLKVLLREVGDWHNLRLADIFDSKTNAPARRMLCHALAYRWAMSIQQIADFVGLSKCGVRKAIAQFLKNSEHAARSVPSEPRLPDDVAQLARAVAGTYGITLLALVTPQSGRSCCDKARYHLSFRLYTELAFSYHEIAALMGCHENWGCRLVKSHAKANGIRFEEVTRLHEKALKKTGKSRAKSGGKTDGRSGSVAAAEALFKPARGDQAHEAA